MRNGKLIHKKKLPSPNPHILLYEMTFWSAGLRVKGLAAIPAEGEGYPGLLYLRGGIKNVGMVRIPRIVQFASQGFVVMAPYYRGNRGGEGNEDFAGEDRKDAFSAYELLQQLPKVDPKNLHIFGFSRGGPMAFFTALRYPITRSAVIWAGVSDMALTYEERVDLRRMMKRVIGGTPAKNPEGYNMRSPVYFCEDLEVPLLLIHGGQDQNVGIRHSLLLKECLDTKKVESWFYPEYTHHFPPQENRKITYALCDWMKTQNKEKPELSTF